MKEGPIQKCFQKASVFDQDLNPVSSGEDGVDPYCRCRFSIAGSISTVHAHK